MLVRELSNTLLQCLLLVILVVQSGYFFVEYLSSQTLNSEIQLYFSVKLFYSAFKSCL